jgi:F0F1-type ATP synthase assembly protein I
MLRAAGTTGAVGIEIALAIILGYVGGEWLDTKFHSTPWLKWIGFAAGVGASVKALVRVTRHYQKSLKNEDESPSPPPASPNDKTSA